MGLLIEEIVEAWFGAEFFLQHEYAFVFQDPADLGFGVENVAKYASAGRAGLEARGELAIAGLVHAVGALLHDALGTDAVGKVALNGSDFLLGDFWLGPIEATSVVGAGGFAVAAADAPIIIYGDDAVLFFPSGFYRTDVYARWVVALLALHRHVEGVGFRNRAFVVDLAVLDIERAFLHLQHANVGVAGFAVVVVLHVTGLGALAAAHADREVEGVSKFDSRLRFGVGDGDVCPVVFLGLSLEPFDDFFHLLGGELLVVVLQKFVDGLVGSPTRERSNRFSKSGGTESGSDAFDDGASADAGGSVLVCHNK